MSIFSPGNNWIKAPHGAEKAWIGLSLVWCVILFLAMPYWHYKGKQNSKGEAYTVTPEAFEKRVHEFVKKHKVGEDKDSQVDIAEPAIGGDAYLLAQQYRWYPVLKMKVGQEYRLHISSKDVQHGFCLLPENLNFHILPGYDHVLTITPTKKGTYTILCNEFCGLGHETMTGKIIVE